MPPQRPRPPHPQCRHGEQAELFFPTPSRISLRPHTSRTRRVRCEPFTNRIGRSGRGGMRNTYSGTSISGTGGFRSRSSQHISGESKRKPAQKGYTPREQSDDWQSLYATTTDSSGRTASTVRPAVSADPREIVLALTKKRQTVRTPAAPPHPDTSVYGAPPWAAQSGSPLRVNLPMFRAGSAAPGPHRSGSAIYQPPPWALRLATPTGGALPMCRSGPRFLPDLDEERRRAAPYDPLSVFHGTGCKCSSCYYH